MRGPTTVQRRIYEYIKDSYISRGFPPSIREIGGEFGISSTNGVRHHLTALTAMGLIEREPGKFRGIRLAEEGIREAREVGSMSVLGRVAAGQPILAAEEVECEIKVDRTFFGLHDSETVFGLRIRGDSMKDAGIMDGDVAIVRRQETAEDGDIVVALLDDEATVKRFRPHGDTVLLEPENPDYDPIIVSGNSDRLSIIGKVIGVLGARF